MQMVMICDCDHLFEAGNFRCTQVNRISPNILDKDNNTYLKCLKRSHKLLKGLELSLKKTRQYEDDLSKCRRGHGCKHGKASEETDKYELNGKSVSARSSAGGTESSDSSTSLVGLQYQFQELCDRYDSLLRALYKRSQSSDCRCHNVVHLRERIQKTHTELAQLHRSLTGIANKYLTLKYKKMMQKTRYKEKIAKHKQTMSDLLSAVETKHREFAERLSQLSSMRHDAAITLLMAEMSKSNDLLLENIRLKTKLEILIME